MAQQLLLCGCVALFLVTAVHGAEVLRLNDKAWHLTNSNGSLALGTTVPAYPLEVLRVNGIIGDPLYRYGEMDSRWVAFETWKFAVEITAEESARLASQDQVVLFLGGVDTIADVAVNGHTVSTTNNFHRHWTAPVKSFLMPNAPNSISINIAPAYNKSVEYQKAHPYYIPTLYNTGSIGAYNFVRKPAFDFGWDWGPAFAASGIHGTVELIAFSAPTLQSAYVAQEPTSSGFRLKITSQFLVPLGGGDGTLTVAVPEINMTRDQDVEFTANADNDADVFEVSTVLDINKEDIQLWWPAGGNYGPHKLYNVTIDFAPQGAPCKSANAQSSGNAIDNAGSTAAADTSGPHGGVDVDLDLSNGFNLGVNVGDLVDFDLNLPFLGPIFGAAPSQPAAGHPAKPSNPAASSVSQCSFLQKRIGFRTVELVQEPLPQAIKSLFGNNTGFNFTQNKVAIDGILAKEGWQWAMNDKGDWTLFQGTDPNVKGSVPESYYFRVNGIPLYLKGANVIPMTVLPSNTTQAVIESMLTAAVESNQNLLRVWGGGLYHPEGFYDFCDENGILIWQDAMFGGSHYPRNPEMLHNIEEEITQQAERLSWHPSVAVWCGSNELELSYEWPNNTMIRSNRNMFVADLMANVLTLRNAIKKVNPSSIFVSSSPTKGALVDTADDYQLRWGWIGDTRYGSVHHYDYMADCEDFRSYPAAKFVTEFGWQSYPLPETYAAAMIPETDWGVGNPMNEFRNRRTDVTPQFLYQYGLHFKLPQEWNPEDPKERITKFRDYLWIGHMQHMRCYETALNFWRRLRSNPQSITMGVMYWQLNDIWAGASWSSVDISGRWKPVHYAVKRAYAPIAVQAIKDYSKVDIFIVSDLVNAVNATVKLQLVSLNDTAATCSAGTVAAQSVLEFTAPVPGLFASRVWSKSLDDLLALRPGCAATTCYLTATANVAGVDDSESQLWLAPFKEIEFADPAVRIEDMKVVSADSVNITLAADRPAALVLVSETDPLLGHFNDNAFSMNPCERRVVTFVSKKGTVSTADLVADAFLVESLYDHSRWEDVAAVSQATAADETVSIAAASPSEVTQLPAA